MGGMVMQNPRIVPLLHTRSRFRENPQSHPLCNEGERDLLSEGREPVIELPP